MWYTSDLHLGHFNSIKQNGRPFSSLEEMHEVYIQNWNKLIRPKHPVYVLGDMSMKINYDKMKALFDRLNGQITLIKGNHDEDMKTRKWIEMGFHDVRENCFQELRGDKGQKHRVLLSHFPYHPVENYESKNGIVVAKDVDFTADRRYLHKRVLDDGKTWLIHGHCHTAWKQKGRQINVGVDVWDSKPVHENQLDKMIEAGPQDIGLTRPQEMKEDKS